jgi:hypothetical protein
MLCEEAWHFHNATGQFWSGSKSLCSKETGTGIRVVRGFEKGFSTRENELRRATGKDVETFAQE